VLAVRKFFDARYGTEGRSIALVNHASTLAALPLASAGNLERTLQHLGKLMDPSRDVLFLFLTSHGEDGLFVVEMPRFDLKPLRPAQLKDMLKRSGIKNSVIVLSACHSGSFLPALADPTTLVIAAARADRSSFGCDDRRQWTYFGEAYFQRALRAEPSFVRAFELARELIARWEAQAKLEPSLPQIGGGETLGPALAAIRPHH
jgi:Peptidase C13 family